MMLIYKDYSFSVRKCSSSEASQTSVVPKINSTPLHRMPWHGWIKGT